MTVKGGEIARVNFSSATLDWYDTPVKRRLIGGYGVTHRTFSEVCTYLPDLYSLIDSVRGKVVFLGNGFSTVPLKFVDRYKKGLLDRPPVIVDVFDYTQAHSDLIDYSLGIDLSVHDQAVYLSRNLSCVELLLKAEAENNLTIISYLIGSGVPPIEITEAQLVVNCFGPNMRSLTEQTSILGEGGTLIYCGFDGRLRIDKP